MKEKYTGSCHMTGGLLISSIMLTTSLKIAQLQSKKTTIPSGHECQKIEVRIYC